MFLDTSGAGGPSQDDAPEPRKPPKVSDGDLAWLLTHLVITIFLAVFAFAADFRGLNGERDSYLLLMTIPITAALAISTWIVFEWYMREVRHPDE